MQFLIIMVLGFLLLWVFAIRPARRRQAEQAAMLEQLVAGTEIITAGGLYGTVLTVEDDRLTVEIAPGTSVVLARRAVAAIVPDDDDLEQTDGLEAVEPGSVEAEPRLS
ncbi:MAG: preprotein translocase subunit YajC [Actinobacteria bacterium]|nr:preprotein translocase subunit YajC [Actinomycetota bacterium]